MAQYELSTAGFLSFLTEWQEQYAPKTTTKFKRDENGRRIVDENTGDYTEIEVPVSEEKRLVSLSLRPGTDGKIFVEINDSFFDSKVKLANRQSAQNALTAL